MQDHELGQFRPKSVPAIETGGKLRPERGLHVADSTQGVVSMFEEAELSLAKYKKPLTIAHR
jgi:hypothetical protein